MNYNKTKIIATIGPACAKNSTLKKMVSAGVNVFRINMSHGDTESKRSMFSLIKSLKMPNGERPCIIADLAGPKIRVRGVLQNFILETNQHIIISSGGKTDSKTIVVTDNVKFSKVEKGAGIKINDGKITLKVVKIISSRRLECVAIVGGLIEEGKGVNFPGVTLDLPPLTDQDLEDLKLIKEEKADWIALSFVRSAKDKQEIDSVLSKADSPIPVIAKIEKWEALQHLEAIVKDFDAVMVARGDLGVEIPQEQVPLYQKKIINEANRFGKPVIIATQMLESMMTEMVPTRAEVSDIANAIYDGTDALMVTGETAAGHHPVAVVKTLKNVIMETERSGDYYVKRQTVGKKHTADAISHATCQAAHDLDIDCIVTMTHSGSTAHMISRYRPNGSIVAFTPIVETCRRLSLVWGIVPFSINAYKNTDDIPTIVGEELMIRNLMKPPKKYIITGGVPVGIPGTTNYLSIHTI